MTPEPFHAPGSGSQHYYARGCRCEECRKAHNRDVRRAWHARQRAANSASYQRELVTSRLRKERHRGICERCGGATSWAGGRHRPPAARFCSECARAVYGERYSVERRGKGAVTEAVLTLADGSRSVSEIAESVGSTRNSVSVTLYRLRSYGMVERVGRGRYRAVAA